MKDIYTQRKTVMIKGQRSEISMSAITCAAAEDQSSDSGVCLSSSPICRPSFASVCGPQPTVRFSLQPTAYSLQSAFTLMELLVVISIIALLLGIIVPSYFSIREKAKYTKAKVTVKNLETAFKAYLDHYRVWPEAFGAGAAKEIDDNVVKILRGDKSPDNNDTIAFYEFESTNSTDGALDAWYDSYDPTLKTRYWVQVDNDYKNQISKDGQVIYRSVIVWSPGADRTNNTEDDVKSWD